MNICFIDRYTEAHTNSHLGRELSRAIESHGHEVRRLCNEHTDVIFCGSIFKQDKAWELHDEYPSIPIVTYNWDTYSWVFTHEDGKRQDWSKFGELLRLSRDVWCPSQCTVRRTKEYFGVDSVVIKSSVETYSPPVPPTYGDYVINVMRKYPDPQADWAEMACEELGIKCVTPNHTLPLDEWRKLVAGCRFLLSTYVEASTGGLSLLEGLAMGKPAVVSGSEWNGARDYVNGASAFFFHDYDDLKRQISWMWGVGYDPHDPLNIDKCRVWVETNYSIARMAKDISDRLNLVINKK